MDAQLLGATYEIIPYNSFPVIVFRAGWNTTGAIFKDDWRAYPFPFLHIHPRATLKERQWSCSYHVYPFSTAISLVAPQGKQFGSFPTKRILLVGYSRLEETIMHHCCMNTSYTSCNIFLSQSAAVVRGESNSTCSIVRWWWWSLGWCDVWERNLWVNSAS